MFSDDRYKEIKLYSKEDLITYYQHYVSNILLDIFESRYIHPCSLSIKQSEIRTWENDSRKDAYLYKYKNNKERLGLDILKNGTYFPIWAYIEGKRIIVSEGIHRIESAKMLYDKGLWNRNFYTIIIPKGLDVSINDKKNLDKKILPIEVAIPVYNLSNNWYKNRFLHHFLKFDNMSRFNSMNNDGVLIITVDTIGEYLHTFKIYHKFLRHAFYKYHEKKNGRIPAAKLFNKRNYNE